MGVRRWSWMAPVLVAAMLSGCSDTGDEDGQASTTVERGVTIGPRGSGCVFPFSLDLAEEWSPEASTVTDEDAEIFGGVVRPGVFTLVCEVDAKPAGSIGFLRVFAADQPLKPAGARRALRQFVADFDEVTDVTFHEHTSDSGLAVTEAEYEYVNDVLEVSYTKRAFLVAGRDGAIVVSLGAFDDEENEEMLPAYELARRSVRAR